MAGRSFEDYPSTYFEISDHFASSEAHLSLLLTLREAQSIRRDIYRFTALAKKQSLDDAFSKRIYESMKNVAISINPSKGSPDDEVSLKFKLNPMQGGLASLTQSTGAPKAEPAEKAVEPSSDGDLVDLTGIEDHLKQFLD